MSNNLHYLTKNKFELPFHTFAIMSNDSQSLPLIKDEFQSNSKSSPLLVFKKVCKKLGYNLTVSDEVIEKWIKQLCMGDPILVKQNDSMVKKYLLSNLMVGFLILELKMFNCFLNK